MLLSIFTPTHNTKHLKEVYDSIELQQHQDWEWIIGLNGGAKLPSNDCFHKDPRVKPFDLSVTSANIGALKYTCCQRAKGETLIELDHDDLLWPDVLSLIANKTQEGADFIYSDAACFDDAKQKPVGYSSDHGWETYPVKLYGRDLLATRNFPISPRSLCEVYYAPDHIRCWRKSFYDKIGGHDISLAVCDDHDLVVRSYLAHGKFAHTGTVGYVYRFHPGNTVKARNAAIQQQCRNNRVKYIHKLVDEWVGREKLLFVNLERNIEWMDNVPILKDIKTSSVGCIRAYNVLHWVPQDEVPRLFEEFFRILAPGGWLCCQVFSTNGPGGFSPSSKSFWNMPAFDYFCDKRKALEIQPYRGRFQSVQCYEAYANRAVDRPWGRVSVYADLCAIKDQRQPGAVRI